MSKIITVTIDTYSGGYIATSKALKGLFISHNTLEGVCKAVPIAIRLLFKAQYNEDVIIEEAIDAPEGRQPLQEVAYLAKAA